VSPLGEGEYSLVFILRETNTMREDEVGWFDFAFETCPPSPRDRFATACRFYIAAFSILTNQNLPIQEPMF
jgi:hypothetical protein